MKKTTLIVLLALGFLIACSGKPQGNPNVGLDTDPAKVKIANRITDALEWYHKRPENTYLTVAWDKRGHPWMEGKQEFLKWIRSGNYFTDDFLQRIQRYLNQQETDAQAYPDLDHFACQEEDLMIGFLEDQCVFVDDLDIDETGGMLLVAFTVQCVNSSGGSNEGKVTHRLKYRIQAIDSTWQIDQTGSIDEKGEWSQHWQY